MAERVFDAVLELLGERGVDGIQYDEVARRAGVGRATVYRRWPRREDLVHDALARFGELAIPVPTTGDLREDLIDFACSMATLSASSVGRALLRLSLDQVDSERIREMGTRLLDTLLPELQARLDAAAADGQIPRVDAGFLNLLVVGPVQLFAVRDSRIFDREDARQIVDVVLGGLAAVGAPTGLRIQG